MVPEKLATVANYGCLFFGQRSHRSPVRHGIDGVFAHSLVLCHHRMGGPLVLAVELSRCSDDRQLTLLRRQGRLEPDVAAEVGSATRYLRAVQ